MTHCKVYQEDQKRKHLETIKSASAGLRALSLVAPPSAAVLKAAAVVESEAAVAIGALRGFDVAEQAALGAAHAAMHEAQAAAVRDVAASFRTEVARQGLSAAALRDGPGILICAEPTRRSAHLHLAETATGDDEAALRATARGMLENVVATPAWLGFWSESAHQQHCTALQRECVWTILLAGGRSIDGGDPVPHEVWVWLLERFFVWRLDLGPGLGKRAH